MTILTKHLTFVESQTAYHERKAEELSQTNRAIAKKHSASAGRFKALTADLIVADQRLNEAEIALKPVKLLRSINLSPDELDGLPEELVKELVSDNDRVEREIFKIIDECGGITSLDRILLGLFKRTGEIHKRTATTSRLYRMSLKGLAYPVPSKKGIYSTKQLTEEEAGALFAARPAVQPLAKGGAEGAETPSAPIRGRAARSAPSHGHKKKGGKRV